ncbi:LytR/AlgR family response regulator transcription factor [Photobacterium sp. TY1-4]|uniref:LytR/AlgR family response regulator transcription factor n=1 Tax=Photobacterium sp. TY1-4 TaxID=2899122 RepID=UPI0021BF3833|nr:LytTR family DNA-binding domain-containing protein [Photobacterium sp. TY1-4]UXI03977.1 LytTR family DNA-binding domain-containing protein [Photobacterium sp. TY1-4]
MTQALTALIADDEPLLRHHLKSVLGDVWPELDVVASESDGAAALAKIHALQPDVVFLDIRMPGIDGIAVARALKEMEMVPVIVFITAYDEYAVQAFEAHAFDYLLKPLHDKRLIQTCERLKNQVRLCHAGQGQSTAGAIASIERLMQKMQSPMNPWLRWIRASKGDEISLVSVDDVIYLRAEDKYVSVYTCEGEYIIRMPLKELIKQLDPDMFWQIHRATIVRVEAIERVKRDFTGKMFVYLAGGHGKLAVSRNAQGLFKQM